MTQALNLANFANNINTSGQLNGSAVVGTVPNATTAGTANALNPTNTYSVNVLSASGSLYATSPNSGSSGGVTIKQNPSGGNAILQFVNSSASAEFADIAATPSGGLNLNGVGGVQANASPILTIANFASSGIKLGLGITGEIWHGVSKGANTTYLNSNTYPIMVTFDWADPSGGGTVSVVLDGGTTIMAQGDTGNSYSYTFIVPPGSTYIVNESGTASVYSWAELF